MVVSDNHVEKLRVVFLHLFAAKVVVLQFGLHLCLHPAQALILEHALLRISRSATIGHYAII